MNDSTKTNNFLNAIQKFADRQREDMQSEIDRFRAEELKKAEEEGLQDAYELIHKEMNIQQAAITKEIAQKEKQSQDELFVKRSHMMRTVFEKAQKKLIEYTSTEDYKKRLIKSAGDISEIFGEKDCVIYLKNGDMEMSQSLADCFKGNVSFKADATIKIGGIRVYCSEAGIIADETLDSRLEDQKEWFIENSELKVI